MDLDAILQDVINKGSASAVVGFGSTPTPTIEIKEAFEMLLKKIKDEVAFAEATGQNLFNAQLSTSIPTKSNVYDCKKYFRMLGVSLVRSTDFRNEIISDEYSDEIETKTITYNIDEFSFYSKTDKFMYTFFIKFTEENGLCEICARGHLDTALEDISML